jgi:ABC-type transporter Mla subunit MlaD
MKLERDDAKIGLLVFLTLALFVGFLFQRSLAAILKQEFHVLMTLENASEVTEGTEVQLQGLRVGAVKGVELQRHGVEYRFLATLGLRTDIVLWQGTSALVVAKPLGGAYIDLLLPPPGKRSEVLLADSVLTGRSGPTLATLVDGISHLVTTLDQGVDELHGQLKSKGLNAVLDHPQVAQIIGNLNGTLQAFGKLATDGDGLVHRGDHTITALDRNLASLEKSLTLLQGLLEHRSQDLDAIVGQLAATLKEMDGLARNANGLVQKVGPSGEAALKALERNLRSTEELLELLKAKPNRVVWGKPSKEELEAAAKRVEEARKAQEPKP